jgi:hypothetical protein
MMVWIDPGYSTPCRKPSKASANFRMTVESTCLHSLTLYRKFLQSVYWRLVSPHAQGSVQR